LKDTVATLSAAPPFPQRDPFGLPDVKGRVTPFYDLPAFFFNSGGTFTFGADLSVVPPSPGGHLQEEAAPLIGDPRVPRVERDQAQCPWPTAPRSR